MDASADEAGGAQRLWRVLEAGTRAVYLVFSLTYVWLVPPGQEPDAAGHAAYVRSLAEAGRLPLPGPQLGVTVGPLGDIVYTTPQGHHPPLYYALLVPLYVAFGGGSAGFILGARLVSVAMGLGSLLLMRAAARRVLPDRPGATAAGLAATGAFTTFVYVMASLNNEGLAVLLVCLSVYLAARALQSQRRVRWALVLGGCVGLALLAKLTAIVAVVPMVAAIIGSARAEEAGGDWRVRAAVRTLAGLAVALAISSPWFVRNWMAFGTPNINSNRRPMLESPMMALAVPGPALITSGAVLEELTVGVWWPGWLVRERTSRLAWLLFTQEEVGGTPEPHSIGSIAGGLLPLLVGAVALWRLWRSAELSQTQRALLGGLIALPVATTLGLLWQMFMVDGTVLRWGPRYTPVFLPSLGLLLGLGYCSLVPRRARPWLVIALVAAAVTVNVLALRRLWVFYF